MSSFRRLHVLVPPPVIVMVAAAVMWWIDRELAVGHFSFAQQQEVAIGIWLAAGLLLVWAIAAFVQARTTVNPLRPATATELLVDGAFGFSRNPIYLADLLLLAGWSVWLGNVLAVVLLPAFVVYITFFQIMPEERALEKLFGDDYRHYCRQVRRWL